MLPLAEFARPPLDLAPFALFAWAVFDCAGFDWFARAPLDRVVLPRPAAFVREAFCRFAAGLDAFCRAVLVRGVDLEELRADRAELLRAGAELLDPDRAAGRDAPRLELRLALLRAGVGLAVAAVPSTAVRARVITAMRVIIGVIN